jgi:outer membrane protein OmpA-like peptidoglycan-associated protein
VADAADRCPFEPENANGVRDADGCPEFEGDAGAGLARVLVRATPRASDAGVGSAAAGSKSTGADAGASEIAVRAGGADAGVAQTFATQDSDGDATPDEADRCPVTPEDPDDFEDDDGCPEPDNDGDGLADAVDRCPAEAETPNGLDDADGCPDSAPDADGDAVADAVDRCPFEPENVDGVRDEDGCPELALDAAAAALPTQAKVATQVALARLLAPQPPRVAEAIGVKLDTDRDGVDDEADRCPLTAEDPDGFEDDDGCPELDNDDDDIADKVDQCALAAETFNGWQDADGCPDEHGDVDGDGVEYVLDRCPLEPGAPSDGCPHLAPPALALPGFSAQAPSMSDAAPPDSGSADFDRDGVPDAADRCPLSAEDKDGFEDDDGCPEPDNDADGLDDAKDKCAFEAETINGNRDEDGCPDPGVGRVHVVAGRVVLDERVQFKTASAALTPASTRLLKQVAAALKAARTLAIEIQGHTDDVGNAAANVKLSQKRAEAIRAALVKGGVAPTRLRATGFGPTRPRASNATAEGREQNRRVEFLIIGEAK